MVCPPSASIEPCQCGFYDETDRVDLFCTGRNLNDSEMSRILEAFLDHPNVSALGKLSLSNNRLTKIPKQIRQFTQLDYVNLDYNEIASIKKGDFYFRKTLKKLLLGGNWLTFIEPGAFQGLMFTFNCISTSIVPFDV